MTGAARRRLIQAGTATGLAAVVLAVAYLNLSAGGTPGTPAARSSPPEKLSILLPVLPHTSLVYVAAAKGYFAAQGLDVTILPVTAGITAVADVVEGRADLAVTGQVPFVIAVMKGAPLGMVTGLSSTSNEDNIVARRDRGIAKAGDLENRRIGVTFGASGSYLLRAFFIRNKLAPETIALVDLPPEGIVQALAEGSVDAVATWQPISSRARAALGSNAISFSGANAYRTTVVTFGRNVFLRQHAGAIEKFARGLLQAEQFVNARPEDALVLVAAWLKSDVESLRPLWKQVDFQVNLLQSHLITMEDQARWAMERGYAAVGPIPNFLPHLYLDALLAVQPEHVTVLR